MSDISNHRSAGRVVVIGSINTDLVAYVERLPAAGETLSGGRFAQFPGSKGANQAVAAARAGAATTFYGPFGSQVGLYIGNTPFRWLKFDQPAKSRCELEDGIRRRRFVHVGIRGLAATVHF